MLEHGAESVGRELADFVSAVQGRTTTGPLINGREGRRSLEVVRAVYESAQRGETIYL